MQIEALGHGIHHPRQIADFVVAGDAELAAEIAGTEALGSFTQVVQSVGEELDKQKAESAGQQAGQEKSENQAFPERVLRLFDCLEGEGEAENPFFCGLRVEADGGIKHVNADGGGVTHGAASPALQGGSDFRAAQMVLDRRQIDIRDLRIGQHRPVGGDDRQAGSSAGGDLANQRRRE